MPNKLKSTGILFAGVFALGYLLNIVTHISRGDSMLGWFLGDYQPILLGAIALFLLSALIERLRWLQPALFLGLSPLAIISDTTSIYGLGFFIMGCLLVERAGYLLKRRAPKLIILAAYLIAIETIGAAINKEHFAFAVAPSFFMLSFGLFLWFLYKDRLVVYLKEPRERLSLTEKGFTPAERTYSLALIGGKSMKEIGYDFELSESTIRNTLAKAYKKLGVEDKAGMLALAERYEIVE